MLSHDKGHTWKTIKETFENDCGYDVYYQVLNAKDYGIPHVNINVPVNNIPSQQNINGNIHTERDFNIR